jgi:hypothetical protein
LERHAAEPGLEGGDDHQPDLGGSAEPDFRLTRGESAAIVEVKEFEPTYLDTTLKNVGPRNVVTTDPEQELETIRRKVRKGAEQLREYQDRGGRWSSRSPTRTISTSASTTTTSRLRCTAALATCSRSTLVPAAPRRKAASSTAGTAPLLIGAAMCPAS